MTASRARAEPDVRCRCRCRSRSPSGTLPPNQSVSNAARRGRGAVRRLDVDRGLPGWIGAGPSSGDRVRERVRVVVHPPADHVDRARVPVFVSSNQSGRVQARCRCPTGRPRVISGTWLHGSRRAGLGGGGRRGGRREGAVRAGDAQRRDRRRRARDGADSADSGRVVEASRRSVEPSKLTPVTPLPDRVEEVDGVAARAQARRPSPEYVPIRKLDGVVRDAAEPGGLERGYDDRRGAGGASRRRPTDGRRDARHAGQRHGKAGTRSSCRPSSSR